MSIKNIILRGMGRSSLFLSNLICTSSVYPSPPKISLSFSSKPLYDKFMDNSNIITIESGLARKTLSEDYVPSQIEYSYPGIVSKNVRNSFQDYTKKNKPETMVISSSNNISLTTDCIDILNSNLRTLLNTNIENVYSELLYVKNLVIINPDYHLLTNVKNYYDQISTNEIHTEKAQPLNIVAIREVSSQRFLQRKTPFKISFQDMSNDVILFDAVDLNPYRDANEPNEILEFYENLNDDVRKLTNIRVVDNRTFAIRTLMDTFSKAYINGLTVLYEVDPLVLRDALTDEVYLEIFDEYIREFQWFVKENEPELLSEVGGSIESSPFNTNSLQQYILDITSKNRETFSLFSQRNFDSRLALAKMDPNFRTKIIKESPTSKIDNTHVSILGLNQFFKTFKFKYNNNNKFMPKTYSLFQLCALKVQLNNYAKEQVRLNYQKDVEFIESLVHPES